MITLSGAELDAWIASFFFPLTRILALLAVAPPFSNAALPTSIRLAIGVAVTFALVPALPVVAGVAPASGMGLAVLVQQMVIGVAMGLAMQIVSAAIDFAGDIIGLQMGLGFATFYDPTNASRTPVISEFLSLLGVLVFFSADGHLMVLATLAESFAAFPVGAPLPGVGSWSNLVYGAFVIFASGLMLALPLVCALLITNTALGVLTRAAPQLNLFAVGFPLTLTGGLVIFIVTLNSLATPLLAIYEHGLRSMLGYFVR